MAAALVWLLQRNKIRALKHLADQSCRSMEQHQLLAHVLPPYFTLSVQVDLLYCWHPPSNGQGGTHR